MDDFQHEARIERLEALLMRLFGGGGGGGDLPLAGDVNGPEGANVLTQILALAGGGTRAVEVNNAGAVIAGTPGGASTVVWRPGGVSAGNVYATWPEVVAAVAKMNGDVTIGLDTDTAAAVIAPGNYDLRPVGISGPVTFVNASKNPPFAAPFFQIGPGAVTIKGLTGLDDVQLDNQSTVAVITNTVNAAFVMRERATVFQTGAGPFWAITNGGYEIMMADSSLVTVTGGPAIALLVTAPGTLFLLLEDFAAFDTNMMTAAAGVVVGVGQGSRYLPQAGAPTIIPTVMRQTGSSAIVVGTGKTAAIPVFMSASARIVVTLKSPVGDALTIKYAGLLADRVNGALGSFKISALSAAGGGAINGLDTSTIDWEVILSNQ